MATFLSSSARAIANSALGDTLWNAASGKKPSKKQEPIVGALSAVCKCALLNFRPEGSKLSTLPNPKVPLVASVQIDHPSYAQSAKRTWQGSGTGDLESYKTALFHAVQWCLIEGKVVEMSKPPSAEADASSAQAAQPLLTRKQALAIQNVFQNASEGLKKLARSYEKQGKLHQATYVGSVLVRMIDEGLQGISPEAKNYHVKVIDYQTECTEVCHQQTLGLLPRLAEIAGGAFKELSEVTHFSQIDAKSGTINAFIQEDTSALVAWWSEQLKDPGKEHLLSLKTKTPSWTTIAYNATSAALSKARSKPPASFVGIINAISGIALLNRSTGGSKLSINQSPSIPISGVGIDSSEVAGSRFLGKAVQAAVRIWRQSSSQDLEIIRDSLFLGLTFCLFDSGVLDLLKEGSPKTLDATKDAAEAAKQPVLTKEQATRIHNIFVNASEGLRKLANTYEEAGSPYKATLVTVTQRMVDESLAGIKPNADHYRFNIPEEFKICADLSRKYVMENLPKLANQTGYAFSELSEHQGDLDANAAAKQSIEALAEEEIADLSAAFAKVMTPIEDQEEAQLPEVNKESGSSAITNGTSSTNTTTGEDGTSPSIDNTADQTLPKDLDEKPSSEAHEESESSAASDVAPPVGSDAPTKEAGASKGPEDGSTANAPLASGLNEEGGASSIPNDPNSTSASMDNAADQTLSEDLDKKPSPEDRQDPKNTAATVSKVAGAALPPPKDSGSSVVKKMQDLALTNAPSPRKETKSEEEDTRTEHASTPAKDAKSSKKNSKKSSKKKR